VVSIRARSVAAKLVDCACLLHFGAGLANGGATGLGACGEGSAGVYGEGSAAIG
jgi:hypothetical protein